MLISPPFLLLTPSHEMETADSGNSVVPEHNVCAANMQECSPGNGAYPVSHNLGWHGGPHLIAPRDAQGQRVPVRAIADGTVVYSRIASDDSPALLYRGVRTDDGCVVLKHETEIGEGESAKVVFFSIYLHLQTVLGSIKPGKKIYRKDTLGVTGEIYGQLGQMHFEIVCDKTNLKKLTGRDTGLLTAPHGRKDAVYGDIWFKVPQGAPIFQKEPNPYRRDDRGSAPCRGIEPQDAILTQHEYVIRMRYELGDCTLTTFKKQDDGRYGEVGTQTTKDYEYDLYREANRLNAGYIELNRLANRTYATVPAPSALYEMIRFGRMLDTDEWPARAEFGHWRQIKTPEANGWISLNQPEIGVYSDADFPHWAGWNLIDDDPTPDSLCDSPTIRSWLDLNHDGKVTHEEAVTALHNPIVRERMAKAICKFPIEWTKNGIDERWGWLLSKHEAQPTVLTKDDFAALKAHIEALAFWEEAKANDATLPAWNDCWHLPPKAFIEHFRKCGWRTLKEMAQTLPKRSVPSGSVTWQEAVSRFADGHRPQTSSNPTMPQRIGLAVNRMMRKYLFQTPLRQAHFITQIFQETGAMLLAIESGDARYFRTMYEVLTSQEAEEDFDRKHDFLKRVGFLRGRDRPHYIAERPAEVRTKAVSLGNVEPGDGFRFRGRGLIHLTGRTNYAAYSAYSGQQFTIDPNPDQLVSRACVAADSAGWYWTSKPLVHRQMNIHRLADAGDQPSHVTAVSRAVNGGGIGLSKRLIYFSYVNFVFGDGLVNPPNLSRQVEE